MTNRDRVNKGLELLRQGLAPYVEREVNSRIVQNALRPETWQRVLDSPQIKSLRDNPISEWDLSGLFALMWSVWDEVFRDTLGYAERSWVSELREYRNRWAHQRDFSSDDTLRVLDTAERLLRAVSAAEEAEEIRGMRQALNRLLYEEQVRNERRKAGGSLLELAGSGGLKPWREVVHPHPDVRGGRYQQAEFAANLWQVYMGEASDEYRRPQDFFRRTYLTEGLRSLLVSALRRLSGKGGEPVVQLQTNFGGGKTHAMLALYHLCSGESASELVGVPDLMKEAGVERLPTARRVVLVGTTLSPGAPLKKSDGTEVRTLWGELAWQLGGRTAYERVRLDDERATNPGDALRGLLRDYGPVLILIDEWVAYARQLHEGKDLPGGDFETHFTFAQALTEATQAVENALLVVSLPASDQHGNVAEDIEVGGVRGREALIRLRNVVGRMESPWRPATAQESYRIVRRRLFDDLFDDDAYKAREVTVRTFGEFYRKHKSDLPAECAGSEYEERIREAYPIHPEVFERLYNAWSTSPRFQRTRGVLRLMANVIQCLWEGDDSMPLILPATIPLSDSRVKSELLRYLDDNWSPIVDSEVDGADALPIRIDGEQPTFGKSKACRRVARTIFLGSAPLVNSQHPGIEDKYIRLGCALPGDNVALFGDALRRLASEATYLYQDGARYWYGTQPTVARMAADRSEQLRQKPTEVLNELQQRLREETRQREPFARVHIMPTSSAEVSDDFGAGLVILSPEYLHDRSDSEAKKAAQNIFEFRGNTPRLYRNTLVFLAADEARYPDLDDALRRYLAWRSIVEESEKLNLAPNQRRQADSQLKSADSQVKGLLPEVYLWLLVPTQEDPASPITWQDYKISSGDTLVARAARKLSNEERLVTELGPTILQREINRIPLWRGNHVSVRQLVQDFAQYVYLSRLASPEVLLKAIGKGLQLLTWQSETFAYADAYDEQSGQYLGLRCGEAVASISENSSGLLVKPDIAYEQYLRQRPSTAPAATTVSNPATVTSELPYGVPAPVHPAPPARPKRFFATVSLDHIRPGPQVGHIAEEILAHLNAQPNAEVRVTLEIHAHLPNGADEQLQRIVLENCKTLKFNKQAFETE
ncbi:MAG: DUF499 domain-containing protein [Saprospiraceae bacterium]|nr:DUF499 domain-containing protein [Saprospiraceae bacterium]